MRNGHMPIRPLTGDELIDFDDSWAITEYKAEYGHLLNRNRTQTSGSSSSGISFLKGLVIFAIVFSPFATAWLLVGGLVYAITNSALVAAIVTVITIIAAIFAAVVITKKILSKLRN